ncbi:patronin isoform X3 [Atheta coriaria]|uniref:patronin isoform X3 n=1 Tax=Dalotia coriaria TaxID=877792 RepID=UPI0031F4480F
MWGALLKIFASKPSQGEGESEHASTSSSDMDTARSSSDMDVLEHESKQAKQRASVKWLLSKAFNNKVPDNLKEPFYRDHENQEHLKPQIVGALANAEMYCLALGNIYSDPNYHNLNHWSILQTLSRKGVFVNDPNEITETTLIQTNPLRMNAHMAVVESIMVLYAKEVVTADRVMAAVQRFSHDRSTLLNQPDNHLEGLLHWVNHTNEALAKKMEQEGERLTNGDGKPRKFEIPMAKDLKDLCDGAALAGLISYYCPDELPTSEMRVSYVPTVADSLHNLGLVQDFCARCLPTSVFHMLPEDITYMRGAMKQNLIVFLADLFNLLEIHPVKCVRYPGMDRMPAEGYPARNAHGVAHKRNIPPTKVMTPIPDLRSGLDGPVGAHPFQVIRTPTHQPLRKANSLQQSVSDMSVDSLRRAPEESFVVHRVKNIPTLSSMIQDEPQAPVRLHANKEKLNHDTKADERGDNVPAGRPSNWNENKRTFAGRRSRRNSTSDDSQLTIENFGGSQDNLNFIGRNPDKEVGAHVGRKISAPSMAMPVPIDNPAVRSTLQDARGSFQLGFDNGCEKHETEVENFKLKRQLSSDDIAMRNIMHERNKENILQDVVDADVQKKFIGGTQTVYMQHENDTPSKSSFLNKSNTSNGGEKKTTTFATLPNTTTWQQQSTNSSQSAMDGDDAKGDQLVSPQLNDIRMQLEEKRRQIENEKRRVEMAMNKQRQKVGKAAFLQAVVKDISDEVSAVEKKWMDPDQPFYETRRTPDMENMDVETYQQSISHMNSSLHDIQADIQKLVSQQNQIQLAQQQQFLQQQHKHLLQQQQQQQGFHHPAAPSAYSQSPYHQYPTQPQQPIYNNTLQTSTSAPHIPPRSVYHQPRVPQPEPQFFLHSQQDSPIPPAVPQRRTWAQQAQMPPVSVSNDPPYQHSPPQPEMRTWGKPQNPAGFMLHDVERSRDNDRFHDNRYHNGGGGDVSMNHNTSASNTGFTLSQQHQLFSGSHHSTPSTSPQHRQHRQISQLLDSKRSSPISLQNMEPQRPERERKSNIMHAPIPAPPADDMEPQSISFIANPDDQAAESLSRLNITSGSRTYRIPSPTRPLITRHSFQPASAERVERVERVDSEPEPAEENNIDNNKKGFYISFDNEQPKRPKPPLRTKKGNSPKKERSYVEDADMEAERRAQAADKQERKLQLERELEQERLKKEADERRKQHQEALAARETTSQERERVNAASAIIIGNDLSNPDPESVDELERKKERILMMSLQRRQQQEESRVRKEAEMQARREKEKAKDEEKQRRKEEQAARRQAILEQHKMKKAFEEAEREGKEVDKSLLNALKPSGGPKLRGKTTGRPRPKTIHIDSGSVEMAEGMLQPARGKKGSSSNLTANSYTPSTMKRDYYRGSQDSLASSGLLYKDSPDDSRGMSPCHSANQTLGRRSSYKTSRDPSPAQTRGRSKYATYQNFKGRKSNSMMNLYGSSTDQDSYAYRYGDTDSGLGRATPPRRAPSPGMGPMRHLTSPSGPGSLPGMMTKRRFDDGSSDLSSTSSMMDYTGPRLYKQPTTKSNRGIMLNAVEYCVFPGVVNKEAKSRVLEEIARSESKHFLILFRDAGCQFRALYSYCPDREEVVKLYGTGPKQVNDRMFDKFFKYNSGGKCFAQVHTKHLTVTIDAFTIHNSLWQGKKVNLPSKKDMTLVI